jgi:hypothetical protein
MMGAVRWAWPALLALGAMVRLAIWWATIGSNDVGGWAEHAMSIHRVGLVETYRSAPRYNHPPLPGLYAAWAFSQSSDENVPRFARLIKLPGLVGEAIALAALWRIGGARLAALYALLPAPILVSAYHGNTDCLCAALALLAALAFDRGRHALAGLALAASLEVKLIPLVLLPLFAVGAPSGRALARFALALGAGLLPFLPPALEAGGDMYRNMLAYNSLPDAWGLNALPQLAAGTPELAGPELAAQEVLLAGGRYAILGGVCALALASRWRLGLSMREQAAVAFAWFLFFAPGFGVQYVVYVALSLLAVDLAWGVLWGLVSGLFIGALYASFLVPEPYWFSSFRGPFPGWTPELGLVAWAGLGIWLARHLSAAWRGTGPAPGLRPVTSE